MEEPAMCSGQAPWALSQTTRSVIQTADFSGRTAFLLYEKSVIKTFWPEVHTNIKNPRSPFKEGSIRGFSCIELFCTTPAASAKYFFQP